MDVLRLDKTTYLPDEIVEGYSSMIWTERQDKNGDFELKTSKVAETRDLIPEGSLITLLDSPEVMFVETHSIGVDPTGLPELTITGRTFETFLEGRLMISDVYSSSWTALKAYTTAEMVALLAWNHLANSSGENPTQTAGLIDADSALPNLVVTDSTTIVEDPQSWSLDTGDVYTKLLDFLPLANLGIRTIRPLKTTGNVVSFDVTRTGTRGDIQKVLTENIQQLRVDIYNGLDRTRNQTNFEPVVFHYNSGHIDSPSYLFSSKDYRNLAIVVSSEGQTYVWPNNVAPDLLPTGINRRELMVDGGPEVFQAALIQKGLVELKKHNRQVLFDGAISPLSPYKYNEEYFLGDTVTLAAEYNFEESMVVTEYVRTEDQNGSRGYPTLILANDTGAP